MAVPSNSESFPSSIILASSNQGKIAEFRDFFSSLPISFELASEVPETSGLDFPETADSFRGNAFQKAKLAAEKTGRAALADDSGLEVLSLDGFPGVKSARWQPGSDRDRNQALLDLMKNQADRRAQFVCELCLVFPNDQPRYFSGRVRGVLADAIRGTAGFGYDSIFIPDGQTQTYAELGAAFKSRHSHRFQALTALHKFLQTVVHSTTHA